MKCSDYIHTDIRLFPLQTHPRVEISNSNPEIHRDQISTRHGCGTLPFQIGPGKMRMVAVGAYHLYPEQGHML